ncbi:MAG: hypothetical protein E7307_13715 [Butyrivibrio sp.]|nr:hypothetical protein [Butyrivibrio sp.]
MGEMKILEKFCKSKSRDESLNEDGYLINDKFIAVVDGATSKSKQASGQKTGGQLLKEIILESLNAIDGNIDMKDAVLTIQRSILSKAPEEMIGHAAASSIIYSPARNEVWMIGDCQMLMNGKRYNYSLKVDDLLSQLRSFTIKCLIKQGATVEELIENDKGREMIMPFLKFQALLENTSDDLGYCVFNNATDVKDFPLDKVIKIDVPQNAEIVLASDGYPELMPTLQESEERLAKILKEDPMCYQLYVGTKGINGDNESFDDRTFVRFQIEQ